MESPICTFSPTQTVPLSVLYPTPTQGRYGWKTDTPEENDKVSIVNYCDYPVYIWSVGARPLGGPRLNDTCEGNAYMTDEDRISHKIEPGASYEELYRMTCMTNSSELEYCPDEDKVSSQAVSLKISKEEKLPSDITQFEYA
jgi:hypothetical protein